MGKGREPLGPTQWVIDSDETWFQVWVSVTKTMGTRGSAVLHTHHYREDATERYLAFLNGEDTEQDFPTVLARMRLLLDTAEKSYNLQLERNRISNK